MTYVQNCAYGIADYRMCRYGSTTQSYQAFVECYKPGHLNCDTPNIPQHSSIDDVQLTYQFGDRVTVLCDASDANFTIQCHNKGHWSGPAVSCPEPAPLVPYQPAFCNAPTLPSDSYLPNLRLAYKNGDVINVTCNHGPDSFVLTCTDGIWNGQNIVCPNPVECSPPFTPTVASIDNVKPRYKIGDEVNITCNDDSDWFVWECQGDGLWRGMMIRCTSIRIPSPGQPGQIIAPPDTNGRQDFFITGLLVAAVILFILVLMSVAMFFTFMRNRSAFPSSTSSKHILGENGERGPLPDVPDGYANYVVGDQALYVEPYLKQNGEHSYEVYEKPV